MYKLVVTDLDGTLLTADHRLGEYTRGVLGRLRRQGVEIMLASGRHYQDVRSLSEQLGSRGCLISSNGAAVHDREAQLVHCHAIDPACLDFLLRDPTFDRVHTNVYRPDDWLVEAPEPTLLRYHQDSGFAYRIVDFAGLDDVPVLKVFYYCRDPDHLRTLERAITERHGNHLTTTYSLPVVLEVMAKGVSKGSALEGVVERLGFAPQDVIAFGDGRNDLEMLRYAGKGVLMANADPGLREALPGLEVIGSNQDESVATYLQTVLMGG